jgi:hypothetical protein
MVKRRRMFVVSASSGGSVGIRRASPASPRRLPAGEAGFPAVALRLFGGSRVLEIDPVKQQIVWEYTGSNSDRPEWTFHSSFISDARRLPNGNTFIDEGMNGRFFQVTPAGEIVWEHVKPLLRPRAVRRQDGLVKLCLPCAARAI